MPRSYSWISANKAGGIKTKTNYNVRKVKNMRKLLIPLMCVLVQVAAAAPAPVAKDSTRLVQSQPQPFNGGFEDGSLKGWKDWRLRRASLSTNAFAGRHAIALGPERAMCSQNVGIIPDSRYRLSAYVRTEAGSEEVQLMAGDYGGAKLSVSSALTEYTPVSLEFVSAHTAKEMVITLMHPGGPGKGYVDDVQLTRLGEAPPPVVQEFMALTPRTIEEEGGAAQQPDETLAWFQDAKFGMFIHWGVYSSMPEGSEWVMHQEAYTPEVYRKRAEDPTNGFTAAKYNPADWAKLAKTAGMEYMVLTTRHHDGYALFDSRHENSWTAVKHLQRDLIREYVDAVRQAGLHVGLYYSPMSWRYPGYYDVTGEDCKPNVWGYTNSPAHKENARLMKEEVYEQVTRLLSNYGPIEYMFWDGGWLGQTVDRDLEDRFWDTGIFQNPTNEWPVAKKYTVADRATGKPLAIMGLTRRYQPQLLVNERFGWVGDIHGEEGGAAMAGPIRAQPTEKCMSLMKGGWGYRPNRSVVSFEEVAVYLSDCTVRNVNYLLNVAPDREGIIPDNQREVLEQVGRWMDKVGDAVHGTRGGPWQPLFGEYGFSYRDNKIYAHIFAGYRNKAKGTFTTQSIGSKQVSKVVDLYSGKELSWKKNDDKTITIGQVDYEQTPYVSILQITLTEDVYEN
jgi:alpha-L-fucosidase